MGNEILKSGESKDISARWNRWKAKIAAAADMTSKQMGLKEGFNGKYWADASTNGYDTFYNALVPGSGKAEILEGELLRAASRIYHDLYNNGFGNNWAGALVYLKQHLGVDISDEYDTLAPYAQGNRTVHGRAEELATIAVDSIMDKVLTKVASANSEYSPNPSDMFDVDTEQDFGRGSEHFRSPWEDDEEDDEEWLEEGRDTVYTIDCERKGRTSSQTGTLAELIQAYSYTLETGKSYEHERGNAKINLNPKNVEQLVRNLNNAKSNAAANGYSGVHYSVNITNDGTGIEQPMIDESDDDQDSSSAVASAITHRIIRTRVDLLSTYGPEAVKSAIDDVAEWNSGDLEEIGSSDVSAWVGQVARQLEHSRNVNESFVNRQTELVESNFNEELVQMRKIAGIK